MSRRRKRAQSAASRSAPTISLAAAREAVREADEQSLRALVDAARPVRPETGQRTPQPSITRWDRGRFAELTLDRLVSILRKAEDGDTEELADLWLRMLKTDAHLESVWETRTAPVYSSRWELTPGEAPPALEHAAARAAQGCTEALRGISDLQTVMSALLNARGLGYAVAEIVWRRGTLLGAPAWVPGAIKPVHGRRFRFSDQFEIGLYDDGRAVDALRKAGWCVEEIVSRGARLARLPAGKYLVHQPIGIHDYPTSTGLVHAIARWWWVKQVVIKYWLGGAELGANPRVIGKIQQNATGEAREELREGLEQLAADGVIVLNEGTEVTISPGTGTSSTDVWDTLLRRMDLAMSKAVLGSTLNVEIDETGGNRAASESQDAVTIRPRQRQDAAQMWGTFQRDLFRWIVRYNPHLFPPSTPLPVGRSVIVEEQVTIDQLAVDSGAVRVDELRRSRGLPEIGGEQGAAFIAPITRAADAALMPEDSAAQPPPPP